MSQRTPSRNRSRNNNNNYAGGSGNDYESESPVPRSASHTARSQRNDTSDRDRDRSQRTYDYDADAPEPRQKSSRSKNQTNYDEDAGDDYVSRKDSSKNRDRGDRKAAASPRDKDDYSSSRRGGQEMAMTTGAVAGASVGSASRKKYNNSEYDDYNQDDATQYDNPYGSNNSRNNDKWGEKEEYDIKTNNSDPYGQYPDEYDQYGYEYPASNEPRWKVFMEKYLCRCCPKSKKHRIICGVVVGIVLLAIIIPLAIFFPQMPDIRVVSISLTNVDKGAYTFTTPDNNGNLNQMTLGFSLEMQLATYNPNMYGLNVDSINVYAQMMVNTSYVLNANKVSPLTSFASLAQIVNEKGPIPLATKKPADYQASLTPQIGTANTTGIFFPSKQWVNYTMTFYLSYTPDPYVGLLNDPAIMEVADSCGITSRYTPRGRPMRIHYEGKSVIAALKPLGYAPGISNDVMISCPIKQCQIDQVIDAVKNGGDAMDSLKSILSAPQNC